MNRALICIDMQPYFDYDNTVGAIIESCRREIQWAVKEKIRVVLVEYEDLGATDKRLSKLVENYELLTIISKGQDNGASEIISELGRYSYSNFRIIGVNTDACIWHTIYGLINYCPNLNIEVVSDAVNTCFPQRQISTLNKLKAMARVAVINPGLDTQQRMATLTG